MFSFLVVEIPYFMSLIRIISSRFLCVQKWIKYLI